MTSEKLAQAEYYVWLNEKAEEAFSLMEGADGGDFEILSGRYDAYKKAAEEFVRRFNR